MQRRTRHSKCLWAKEQSRLSKIRCSRLGETTPTCVAVSIISHRRILRITAAAAETAAWWGMEGICPRVTLRTWWKHRLLIKPGLKMRLTGAQVSTSTCSILGHLKNAAPLLKLADPHQADRCLQFPPAFTSFPFAKFRAITGRKGRHNGWFGGTVNTKTGEKQQEIHQAKYSRAADRPKFSCHLVFYCPSLPPSPPDIRRKRLQGLLHTQLHPLHLQSAAICSYNRSHGYQVSGYGNASWPTPGWNKPFLLTKAIRLRLHQRHHPALIVKV